MPFIKSYNGYKHITDQNVILGAIEMNEEILWFENAHEVAAHLNIEKPLDYHTWFGDGDWVGMKLSVEEKDLVALVKSNPEKVYTIPAGFKSNFYAPGFYFKNKNCSTVDVYYSPKKEKQTIKRTKAAALRNIKKPDHFKRSIRLLTNQMSRLFTSNMFGYGLYSSPAYNRADELCSIKHFLKVFDMCKKYKIDMENHSVRFYVRRFIPLIKEYSIGNDEQKKFARSIKYILKANKGKMVNV